VPPTDSEASGAASFSIKDNLISYNIEVSRMDVSGGDVVADLAAGEKVE
jgi:hypothetical protein